MLNAMQKAALDGMRLCCKALFWSADMTQDQMRKAWTMMMEQNGKMRNEMEAFLATWSANARRGMVELQDNLERGMSAVEESLNEAGGSPSTLYDFYARWPEMQAEAFRSWTAAWGLPAAMTAEKGVGENTAGQAAKNK